MSNKLLEQAITALLNEQNDKAEELFHKFLVQSAKKITESLRNDDLTAEPELEEAYFTEGDLNDLEDDSTDDAADTLGGDLGGEDDMTAGDDMGAGDDLGGDLGGDVEGDMEGDLDGGSTEDRLADLEDQLAKITSEFEELMAEIDPEGGVSDEDDFGDADNGGDMGGEDLGAEKADEDDLQDDMGEEEPQLESVMFTEEDDFDDLAESIIDELEKVSVDGKKDGRTNTGASVPQNNKPTTPNKDIKARQGGEPIRIKAPVGHTGFERETPLQTAKPVVLKNKTPFQDPKNTKPVGAVKPVLDNKTKTSPVKK